MGVPGNVVEVVPLCGRVSSSSPVTLTNPAHESEEWFMT